MKKMCSFPKKDWDTDGVSSGYRMTELGLLPEDWEVVRLGEIFEETNVRVKDRENKTEIPILSITRHDGLILQSQKFEKRIASNNIANYKVIHRGEMVYGFPMDEGVIYFLWNFEKGAVSPVYYTWRLIRKADPYYLDYALKSPIMMSQYEKCMTRTVHRRRIVKPKDFISLKIPLPPLPEQKAIARVLRTIQDAIEATERVIAAAKELKKSLMRHLFTYGPVPLSERDRVRLKQTEIGPIPEDWEVVRLGDYCRLFSGYAFKSSDFVDSGIMVVKIGNLQNGTIIIDKRTSYFPPQKVTRQIEKYRLYEGDVLIALTGATTGKIAVVPKEFEGSLLNQRVGKFETFSRNLCRNFFRYLCLLDFFQKRIKENILQSAQGNISPRQIEQILIPLPPLSVQQKIARILKAVDDKIEAEEKKKEALQAFFKTMLHHLMTGKIRVKNIRGVK